MKSVLYFDVALTQILVVQTNELYQLASVAFCLLVAWVSFISQFFTSIRITCLSFDKLFLIDFGSTSLEKLSFLLLIFLLPRGFIYSGYEEFFFSLLHTFQVDALSTNNTHLLTQLPACYICSLTQISLYMHILMNV